MVSKLTLSVTELLQLNLLMALSCLCAGAGGVTAELAGFRPFFDSFMGIVVFGSCAPLMSIPRLVWSQSGVAWSEATKQAERSLVAGAGLLYVVACALPVVFFLLMGWALPPVWIQLATIVLGGVAGFGAISWFRARSSW
jgi:hypothetical protein